jgi:hypothetical protein
MRAKTVAMLVAYYLIRHMSLGDGVGVLNRGEEGPFDTLSQCEAELTTFSNQQGLECVQGWERV